MSKQPRAIELADQLKERFGATVPTSQAAAELRRLHEANADMAEALESVVADWTSQFERNGHLAPSWCKQARAVLSKHKEQA
jgi:hypothetical protein